MLLTKKKIVCGDMVNFPKTGHIILASYNGGAANLMINSTTSAVYISLI